MKINASFNNKPYPADLAHKAAAFLDDFLDAVNQVTDFSDGYWIEQDNNSALFTLEALRDFEKAWCTRYEHYDDDNELD